MVQSPVMRKAVKASRCSIPGKTTSQCTISVLQKGAMVKEVDGGVNDDTGKDRETMPARIACPWRRWGETRRTYLRDVQKYSTPTASLFLPRPFANGRALDTTLFGSPVSSLPLSNLSLPPTFFHPPDCPSLPPSLPPSPCLPASLLLSPTFSLFSLSSPPSLYHPCSKGGTRAC
jgi:hypothetical protein